MFDDLFLPDLLCIDGRVGRGRVCCCRLWASYPHNEFVDRTPIIASLANRDVQIARSLSIY